MKLIFLNVIMLFLLVDFEMKFEYDNIDVGRVFVV